MTGPSITKPVPQTNYIIPNQASSLPDEMRARYIELLRDGSPEAIATAMAIHSDARQDSSDIRACREALQLIAKAEAERPAAERKVGKLDDQLVNVRAEIERLQEVERELTQQVSQVSNAAPHADGFRRRAKMCATNAIVRLALADELQAAGV